TEGHLPSIIAVAGIFTGLSAGLSPLGRRGIDFLTGLSESWKIPPNIVDPFSDAFAFMAVGIALIGLSTMCLIYRRRILDSPFKNTYPADGSWPLFGVAVIVGLLGWAAIVVGPSLGRTHPLGASHMPYALLKYVFEGNARIVGLIAWTFVLGSALSAWLRGKLIWRTAPKGTLVLAYFGGVLVGFGAILGGGCFVGQVLSGWALLSIHALIFGITMILANWATTLFYLRGWR
ncbi:MAG: YeeE/YedE thiosulfate transporter family protein, partial [Acidobacteriota bacterium]